MLYISDVVCKDNDIVLCPRGQFRCDKSGECLPDRLFCDKVIDCQDKSDEYKCRKFHFLRYFASSIVIISNKFDYQLISFSILVVIFKNKY